MKNFILSFVFSVVCFQLIANGISGTIATDTIWSGEVNISGNVTVNSGVTLTIQAGTIISFDGNHSLNANGILMANGAAENRIVFKSSEDNERLGTVSLDVSDPVVSEVNYWKLENLDTGIELKNQLVITNIIAEECNIGVRITSNGTIDGFETQTCKVGVEITSTGTVSNGLVFGSTEYGIIITGSSTVDGVEVTQSYMHGIYIRPESSRTIHINNCNIHNNGVLDSYDGIYAYTRSSNGNRHSIINLNNTVSNSSTRDGMGFYGRSYHVTGAGSQWFYHYLSVNIDGGKVHNNNRYGINGGNYVQNCNIMNFSFLANGDKKFQVHSSTNYNIINNWWGTTSCLEIMNIGGSSTHKYVPFLDGPGGNSTYGKCIVGSQMGSVQLSGGNTYKVIGNTSIEYGHSMIIEPGANIHFLDNYSWNITGQIIANGTPGNRIVFTSGVENPQPGSWQGIKLNPNAHSFKHCEFHYAATALSFDNIHDFFVSNVNSSFFDHTSNIPIEIDNSIVNISDCTIKNFGSSAVRITGSDAHVDINGLAIFQQTPSKVYTANGIYASDGANVSMSANTISLCNRGIYARTNDETPVVLEAANNIISRNKEGININASSSFTYPDITMTQNDITQNIDWNVYVDRGSSPGTTELDFRNTYWHLTDSTAIKAKIYDHDNSSNSAKVLFMPFSNTPHGNYGIADINKDGRTDGLDLAILAASFGLYEHEEGYNPEADINNSGRVDGFDLALLGINFGIWGPGNTPFKFNYINENKPVELAAHVNYNTLNTGDTIEYVISASNAENLFAMGISAIFDSDILQFHGIMDGGLLSDNGARQIAILHDNRIESVYAAVSRIGHVLEFNPPDGNVLVFRFILTVDVNEPPKITFDEFGVIGNDGNTDLPYVFMNNISTNIIEPLLFEEDLSLLIYPNPLNGIGRVEYIVNGNKHVLINIFDITGRRHMTLVNNIVHEGVHSQVFDVGHLPAGVYVCIMQQGNLVKRTRFVIQ